MSPAILLSSLLVSWIHQQFHSLLLQLINIGTVGHFFFSRSFTNMLNIIRPDSEPCQSPMAIHLPWNKFIYAIHRVRTGALNYLFGGWWWVWAWNKANTGMAITVFSLQCGFFHQSLYVVQFMALAMLDLLALWQDTRIFL